MVDDPPVLVDRPHQQVLRLLINRPEVRNAINGEVAEALHAALAEAGGDPVLLGSAEPGIFSAGADLRLADDERASVSDRMYQLYQQMVASPSIIIAAADGPAIGGGGNLLLASDIRIASTSLAVQFPGAGHGLSVGAWGLTSLVGRGRAMEICLSMRRVEADEALAIGLVSEIAEDPMPRALDIARQIAGLDRESVARIKHVSMQGAGLIGALAEERELNRRHWSGSIAGLEGRQD